MHAYRSNVGAAGSAVLSRLVGRRLVGHLDEVRVDGAVRGRERLDRDGEGHEGELDELEGNHGES